VASTRSRPPRGREQARHASGGTVAEHTGKIYSVAICGVVVIVAFLTFTSVGHVVDAAVQHFMLFYAGVFALIALCASVGLGFVATDRMVLSPGHRVFVQSAHRAASFGALAFLVIHIVTEILAQRVHVLDAFIPFLSPFRTFYIGLGTIASDLIILIVITSILRKRFTANGNAWKWRAIHYASYASFVFGVWHGLLGGRPGKPYVDWSYGFVVAFVALGLAVRILSNSLRPKETLSSAPVPEAGTSAGSAPMRAASMFAQLGIARAGAGGRATGPIMVASEVRGILTSGPNTGSWNSAAANSGPMPALAAPVAADIVTGPPSGPLPGYQRAPYEQPVYEPGYDGPPRFRGAPRHPGTGPQPRFGAGARPGAAALEAGNAASGPMPRAATGPMPRAATGPMPSAPSGPMPRAATGPMPSAASGPLPRAASGPMPRAASGPMPRATSGPMPRAATGPLPAERGRGPLPGGPRPGGAVGAGSRPATGPMPQHDPRRQAPPGPVPGSPAGPGTPRGSRPATGPMPRAAAGPLPAQPRAAAPAPPAGAQWQPPAGPMPGRPAGQAQPDRRSAPGAPRRPRAASGPYPTAGGPPGGGADYPQNAAPPGRRGYGPPPSAAPNPYATGGGPGPSWDASVTGADPGLRYREPGPGMPGYRAGRPRGTDPYAVNPYGIDLHDTDPYGTGHYPAGQYGWDVQP